MIIHTIEARTHGRYLVEPAAGAGSFPMLVGFHGYGEDAGAMLEQLRAIGQGTWLLASVQALNRFYARNTDIVANWMTKQDRELAIADNVAYVSSVVAAVRRDYAARRPLVYVGFSQGVAMAYRAAVFGDHPCDGLIVLAGDVPPDVAPRASSLPSILLGRGAQDQWYTADKAAADLALLRQVPVTEHVFDRGHVWDRTFIERARAFVSAIAHDRVASSERVGSGE